MKLFSPLFMLLFSIGQKAFTQPVAHPQLKLYTSGKPLFSGTAISLSFAKKDSDTVLPVQSRMPLDYYNRHLGAACKMELQLEKQTKLPIRIRLGSKEQVDYLEGKFIRNR